MIREAWVTPTPDVGGAVLDDGHTLPEHFDDVDDARDAAERRGLRAVLTHPQTAADRDGAAP